MTAQLEPISAETEAKTGASQSGASVTIENVSKRYGDETAVDGVSIEIEAGEFMTFLGPSGSGKTTTLNMIAGFTDVTEGRILMDGESIEGCRPHRRNIGLVFQSYALFPHMTVFQNVAYPLKRRRVAKEELARRVAEALEMVHLGGYESRYPAQLSGGQQQRVALARAIVFRPRVLLMDEPLGALDKKLREWLQTEIKRIHEEVGITFVYVTHDQEEALALSDRIAVFRDGRIEQLGSAHDLYMRPSSRFVAEFLGESNIFSGPLTRNGRGAAIDLDGQPVRLDAPAGFAESEATVVVRPECVSVRAGAAAPEEHTTLAGSVSQVIYLGSSRRLEVALPSGQKVIAKEQAGSFGDADQGDEVTVSWSAGDAVLIAGEPPSPSQTPQA